ncbi:hypothetical protein ACIQCF_33130 [Streptomyces sp. NPDC088353]|uniref:hypothetical protein n=1 Tax=Streptomyces sp. NPDC088353 TaxID=3365855 RepID=UPI0037F762FD
MRVRLRENVGAYYRAGRTYDIPDDEARGYISRDLAEPDGNSPEPDGDTGTAPAPSADSGPQTEPKASREDEPAPGDQSPTAPASKPAAKPAARTTGGRRGGRPAAAKTPKED